MQKPKVIAIVGPTSSGKTSLSIDIAKTFSGEVISADSRQIYRGMDLGTGKVTVEEMNGIPHHLLDVADPTDVFTATDFVDQAGAAVDEIYRRSRLPIVAGGSFFYVDLLRGRMSPAPVEPNPAFRANLEQYSNEELLEQLRTTDLRRADSIDPHNRRRLIRSLEIIDSLGAVPEPAITDSPYDWLLIGLAVEKEVLRDKFKARLQDWLDRGLVDEVQHIRSLVLPARFQEFGFEYTLTAQYIDQVISHEEFFQKFVEKNWQYAKRQQTWLRKDEQIEWFTPDDRQAILARCAAFLDT